MALIEIVTVGPGDLTHAESYEDLKTKVPKAAGQRIRLLSHISGWAALAHGPVGGGEFVARSGTAVDDGGYICVPTGQASYYWQRISQNPGKVCATEFGLYDGAALDSILTKAIGYCIKNSLMHLSIPAYTLAGSQRSAAGLSLLTVDLSAWPYKQAHHRRPWNGYKRDQSGNNPHWG